MVRKLVCVVAVIGLGLAGSVASGDIASGLVGHWPLDGNASDVSGNGLDGEIVGDVVSAEDRLGYEESAMLFPGARDSYIELGDPPELQITGAMTLAAWVRIDSFDDNGRIIARIGGDGSRSYSLNVESDTYGRVGALQIAADGSDLRIVSTVEALPFTPDDWFHIAGTYEPGAVMRIYINGQLDNENTENIPTEQYIANTVRIGKSAATWGAFAGSIDEARAYTRVLSPDDIRELYEFSPLPRTTAWKPEPADGAMLEVMWVQLSWKPGTTAVSHDVYLADNFEDVNAGAESAFQGNHVGDFLITGFPGYPIPDGLVPGTTYYWRVDDVEADGKTNTGEVWSFWIPSKKAYDADPPDGAENVGAEPTLTWTSGFGAKAHYAYFGTNADEVAAATGAMPQVAATFTPDPLEMGTTYYWRVDEFDGATTYTGDVWSFSTIPVIEVTDPSLVGWWKFDEGRSNIVVDWSGNNRHATVLGEPVWESGPAGFDGALNFKKTRGARSENFDPTGGTGKFTLTLWCRWDGTQSTQHFLTKSNGWGADTMMMQVEVKGGHSSPARVDRLHLAYQGASQAVLSLIPKNEWAHVALTFDGINANSYLNGINDVQPQPTGIGPNVDAPVWIGVAHNDARVFQGLLDDVRLFNKVLTADEITTIMRGDLSVAWNPSPANESTPSITVATPLTWSAGDGASKHDVYFGADQAAVEAADASDTTGVYRGQQNGTSYNPGADVAWGGGPYYWRVDEVKADGTITTGRLWSFTVADFLVVEDFEAYNNIDPPDPASNTIYSNWIDGYGIPTNGALTSEELPPYAEQVVVHGGGQSMKYLYDTNLKICESTLTLVHTRNWTEGGVTRLVLWFRGDSVNTPERMFVALNGNAVVYHDDPTAAQKSGWTEWVIDLQAFADQGVNLSNVNTITIGFGTKGTAAAGGIGTVYFDDIRLYQ